MMPVARLGDRTYGTCSIHGPQGGTICTGSTDTLTNNMPTARLGDQIIADCGDTATIITSSVVTLANNLGVARLGDLGAGTYECTIVTGSTDTFSG